MADQTQTRLDHAADEVQQPPPTSRIEIAPGVLVLNAGPRGWALCDDDAEEAPIFPTREMAVKYARELAAEKEFQRAADEDRVADKRRAHD